MIIKNRAIGDAIMTLAGLHYIKEQFPSANIYYAVPEKIAPLFKECQHEGHSILPFSLDKARGYWRLWQALKRHQIDTVIELHQGGRTRRFFTFWKKFKNHSYFYHNHHKKSGLFVFQQGVIKALIQRDLDLCFSIIAKAAAAPKPVDGPQTTLKRPHYLNYTPRLTLLAPPKKAPHPYLIFGVVATRDTKRWPLDYFVSLAKLILKNHPQFTIKIPLSNSPVDCSIEQDLMAYGLPPQVKFVKVPLEKLPIEMAQAKLYIGNDTGPKHLAVALNIKTFTFFGPEPPLEWHPYDSHKHPFFYRTPLPCRTQKAHYCALSTCDSMICLNEFTPEKIYGQLQKDLKGQ